MTSRPSLPLSGWPLILLCAFYLLAGLLDHDPWKIDDAMHVGVAYEFATHGDWLHPRIAHSPWFVTPPLFHWMAAFANQLLAWALPLHFAARLITAFWGVVLLWVASRSALALHAAPETRSGTPLLLIGTLGLLTPIHDAQPVILLLTAQALNFLALAWLLTPNLNTPNPNKATALLAFSFAIGLLSAGLMALPILLPMVVTSFAFPLGRRPKTALRLLTGTAFGILLASLWPLALALYTPEQTAIWWQAETGRFLLRLSSDTALDHLELLGWAAWPLWPLAGWTLWNQRRQLLTPALALPLVGSLAALLSVLLWSEARPLQHLPIYVPLALLAAAGIPRLRRGAANALDWFGMMTFSLIAGLIWLGGVSMLTGEPERVARNFLKAEPGFVGHFSLLAYAAAACVTALWFWSLLRLAKSPWRAITHWAAGMTLTWTLLACLWMPWIDYGKTYRPVAASLKLALEGSQECIGTRNLGDGQKASLRYFSQLNLSRSPGNCPWLLTQGNDRKVAAPEGWDLVWEGHRIGDRQEKLRLYRRL